MTSKPLTELTGPFIRKVPASRSDGLGGMPATEITEEGYQLIEGLAARGCAMPTIAKGLGIKPDLFRRIRNRDTRAREAVDCGKAVEHDKLVDKLNEKAMAGDITAIIFALKSRHGYRDNSPVESEGGSRVHVEISLPAPMSPDEYQRSIDVTPEQKKVTRG